MARKYESLAHESVSTILKESRKEIIYKFITSILIRGSLLVFPIFWSKAVNAISNREFNVAFFMVGLTLITNIIYYLSEAINQKTFYNMYNKIFSKLTSLASEKTFKNSMYSLSRFSLGEYTNIMNNDINVIASFYSNTVIRIVQAVEFLIIFGYFFYLDFYMFLTALIVSVIMLVVLIKTSNKTSEYNRIRKGELDKKTSIIHEVFSGIKEIKGFNVYKLIDKKVENATKRDLTANENYQVYIKFVKIIVLGLIEVSMYSLIIYGVYLISIGKMELGTILIIYTYYTKIVTNFDIVGTVISEFKDLQVSTYRFNKLLEFCKASNEGSLPEKKYNGYIEFNHVIYGNKNDPILNDVTFDVSPNSITVVTGRPSTGKTGILDLLLRMNRQHEGSVTIDGDDINAINEEYYDSVVSAVIKNPHFFNLSIRENLLLICSDEEKIVEVCKKLKIHDSIMNLSKGYDTNINGTGENIPGNLRRMLSIARVLAKDSKIMLFDELISMLEDDSKKIVHKILVDMKKDHTILLISRDSDVIRWADKVIVMDDNKIKKVQAKKVSEKNAKKLVA